MGDRRRARWAPVRAGEDREGVRRGMGITGLSFKVLTEETGAGSS